MVGLALDQLMGSIPKELSLFLDMDIIQFDGNNKTYILQGVFNKSMRMNEMVGLLNSCHTILCPNNTWNINGKAGATECQPCKRNQYFGSRILEGNTTNIEKVILDSLYTATGGRYWILADNWTDPEAPLCHREGVNCNGMNGDSGVTELRLNGMGLNGTIPPEIFDLPSILLLEFSNNDVDIKFDGLAKATKLETLQLSNTSIRSLKGIGQAPATLTEIHLADNQITGSLPDELFNLTNVIKFFASDNLFTGSIPNIISKISLLQELYLAGNHLIGKLPSEFSHLSRLEKLDLQGNKLSGNIPTSLASLVNLKSLLLGAQWGDKKMSGPLFDFMNNKDLIELDLSGNELQGTIPPNFLMNANSTSEIKVFLSNNAIEGEIPITLIKFTNLYIDLSGNKISNISNIMCSSTNKGWMGGNLERFGCDAFLCPPGKAVADGRQVQEGEVCVACPNGTVETPYFGSATCFLQNSSERIVLMSLFKILNGDDWINHTNWNSGQSVCTWFGIACDEGRVTGINLENNNLTTTDKNVSPLLFSLPYLNTIDLKGNSVPLDFTKVPAQSKLQILKLAATGLKTLKGVSKVKDLRHLHVTENLLFGKIPDELFDLTNLQFVFLSFNSYENTLPSLIAKLKNLEEFYLYENKITGQLPSKAISNLTNLKDFIMAKNCLTGEIPTEFSSLPKLEQLSLYDQHGKYFRLNGTIPNFSGAPNLWFFDVFSNDLSGSIPTDFMKNSFNRSKEVTINLGENVLTGTIPSSLDSFTSMDLSIVGNLIVDVPNVLCDNSGWMQGLVEVVGTCAAIACPPGTWSTLGKQETLEKPCDECMHLEFAAFWGQNQCDRVSLEKAMLLSIYTSTGGKNWTFNRNWDSDEPICNWEGISCVDGTINNTEGVIGLALQGNNLVGTFPSEVFSLPYLSSLNLGKNYNLTFTFAGIHNAKNLEVLSLSSARLDNLNGISDSGNLRELDLTDCGLTGSFPTEILDLSSTLVSLYIGYNFFSGTLPPEIGRLSILKGFYAFDNDFSGTIPSEVKFMLSLETMVLAENLISGTIPALFSSLPNLLSLSIYRRDKPGPRLSGPLPPFDKVPRLESLSLDGNDLTGMIPDNFLYASKNASFVVLAHNQLNGVIPEGIGTIPKLNIQLEGNQITRFPPSFCNKSSWMDGQMIRSGCDAFLCPPGFANAIGRIGRENFTKNCTDCGGDGRALFFGSTSCDAPFEERKVLIRLYQKCGGRTWHRHDGWTTDMPVCEWYGIACNAAGSVESIHLGSNNLVGLPDTEVFNLINLKSLWLHSNPIDVSFENIGAAKRLTDLRLDSTRVKKLDNLDRARFLTVLDLQFNQLKGTFPNEILKLTNLRSLNMGNNKFTGPLPPSFVNLRYLRTLRLGTNQFTGKLIPFDDMEVLRTLDISDNALTGEIPSAFFDRITTSADLDVDLSSNQLSGIVPVELARFDNLTVYLRENEIIGLPTAFCNNVNWNSGDVELYGCDGILCPPGTFNIVGRARGKEACLPCGDDQPYFGRVECALFSSSSIEHGWILGIISILICIAWI